MEQEARLGRQADRLLLERRAAVLARLRRRFAAVPSTVSLVDELLADRCAEARRQPTEPG